MNITITPTTQSEIAELLEDRELYYRLVEGLDGDEPVFGDNTVTIRYGNYFILGTWKVIGEGLCEVHMACHKKYRKASKLLALEALKWVFEVAAPDTRLIITTCRAKQVSNFLLHIGFRSSKWTKPHVYVYPNPKLYI